jgi:hypothetical protein
MTEVDKAKALAICGIVNGVAGVVFGVAYILLRWCE